MFRISLSAALIFILLCGQWVAVQHTHAGMSADQQREHDAHPHIHVGTASKHSHTHHHKHTSHKSHVVPAHDGFNADHDADAIYVKSVTLSNHSQSLPDFLTANTPLALHDCLLAHDALTIASAQWHPPDKLPANSDLYLILRNLRI